MIGINKEELGGEWSFRFKYTIREYDHTTRTVTVDYANGTWAKFKLMEPLPKDREELDVYIRQFTDPVEYELAVDDDSKLEFIEEMIGKTYETARRWLRPKFDPDVDPNPEPTEDFSSAEIDTVVNEVEREVFGVNDNFGEEYSKAAMVKLLQEYQKVAYLLDEPMFSTLTDESQKSLMDWESSMLSQIKQAQAAIDADRRFDPTIPVYELKFKTEG